MDAPTATAAAPALLFDGTAVDTAAASALQAIVALQQALARTPGMNPMSPMTMVQMAAAATKMALVPPIAAPLDPGMFSPELDLTFALRRGRIKLTIPAIGPHGATNDVQVRKGRLIADELAIEIFSWLWQGVFDHLSSLTAP